MNTGASSYVTEWDQSYANGDNNIRYPQTEVIRFINRFIRKRASDGGAVDLLAKSAGEQVVGLDFACGIGTHGLAFADFGIEGYGADISQVAITVARRRAATRGIDPARFVVLAGDTHQLPYDDGFFDFVVAESCLDSMPYGIAENYVRELRRVARHYIYASFIGPDSVTPIEEFVDETRHELGTIQSVYDVEKISRLFGVDPKDFAYLRRIDQVGPITSAMIGSRYYAVLNLG